MTPTLPGLPKHQQVLRSLLNFYADDPRIEAILLFGSLSRGNWDTYSDLDLDIVISDAPFDVPAEFLRLCDYVQQEQGLDAIVIADEEEGDVVLSNLVEFSIRYHPLATTKPAILDSMMMLKGHLSLDQIRAAGEANRKSHKPDCKQMIDQCVRYCLEVRNAILRGGVWLPVELLHRIRSLLMNVFTFTHGGDRPIQFFEAHAAPELQNRLSQIVAAPELTSLVTTLDVVIHLLTVDLEKLSAGRVTLTDQQRAILQRITEPE